MSHKLQSNRFELKYLVDESQAVAIRDFLQGYLVPDENGKDRPNSAYPVYTLYLDSPTLTLYRQTILGLKNRFKLRIRFYDDVPINPAFLEIKRRIADAIRKERAAIHRDTIHALVNGGRPDASHLFGNGDGQSAKALDQFCVLYEELGAIPSTYVSYFREAYVLPESEQLRVTFDRHIRSGTFDPQIGLVPPINGADADVAGVVLELKYVDRFPNWMQDLVWAFNLQRCSVPKYILGVEALGIRPGRWLDAAREVTK